MKSILKISSLLSALVLAGCATAPQENVDAAAPGKVQVECGVNSPPGTTTADVLRQRAVDAMANLPAKQRIEASETLTTEQVFKSGSTNATRNVKVLDSVSLDLPWAVKSRQ